MRQRGGKVNRTLNQNQEKAVLFHGKILILKFTLVLTFKLKGIACNPTQEARICAFK